MRIPVIVLIGCCMIATSCGCQKAHDANPLAPKQVPDANGSQELAKRDIDIITYLLQQQDFTKSPKDIHFLTLTPMSEWGENGEWKNVPYSVEEILPRLSIPYRDADEAYLKDGNVLVKGSNSSGWMRWITIKRWISDSEVEVEEGVWCCDLGGGASTTIYSKVNGKWELKESVSSWVS